MRVGENSVCEAMASTGISANAVFRGNILNLLSEAQAIRRSTSTPSLSSRLVCSLRSDGHSDRRVFANARQCAERSSETSSNDSVNDARSFPSLIQSETVGLPASLEGNEGACGEHWEDLLQRSVSGVADLSAPEAFAISGNITGADMERLVESLVHEEGQSLEDYRQRAITFGKVAEFFRERRTYSTPKEESWSDATEIPRTMQVIVDVVLEGEGRSAMDYRCRAQLFAKSAEVFPFNQEVRSS